MLNAALATYALPRFAAALRLANVANDTWREAEQFAASQRTGPHCGALERIRSHPAHVN